MKRPQPQFDPRDAVLEAQEARRWSCASCDAPIDPDNTEHPNHCWPCGSYWEDVANGLWDDPV